MERYPEETESDFRDEIEAGNTPKTDTEEGICPEKPRLDSLPFWGVFFAMEILVSAWVLLIMEWFQSFRGGFELFGNEVNELRINSHGFWAAITFVVLPVHELLFGFVGDSLSVGVKIFVKMSLQVLGLVAFGLTFYPIIGLDPKIIGIHTVSGTIGILGYMWDLILCVWNTKSKRKGLEEFMGYSQPTLFTLAHGAVLTGYGAMFVWAKSHGYEVDRNSGEFYLFPGLVLIQLIVGGACIVLAEKRHHMKHHWDLITRKEIQQDFCSVLDKVYPEFRKNL